MVDLLRWGLDVDYPVKVSSNGGRYRYKDDWETPDTQVINLDFKEGVTMSWEGRSCNGKPIENTYAGALFYGEKGSMFINGNSYTIYDLENKIIKDVKNDIPVDPLNVVDPAAKLDSLHIQNFFGGIINGTPLNAGIDSGHKSTLLVQLGNISQRVGRSINIDTETGHILNDKEAESLWARTYEEGWKMKI